MTTKTFVILAAGRGTRIGRTGEHLHKALVPLEGKAVLSHLIELAPGDSKIVICLGHRSEQIEDYVALAHPHLESLVTYVLVDGWDKPGGGPGHSLIAAQPCVEGDLIFTSCDTLWERDDNLWWRHNSWVAVAPIPAGTDPMRWCRVISNSNEKVTAILDKVSNPTRKHADAYVGLSCIMERDLPAFWRGVANGVQVENELQVSGGLGAVSGLESTHVVWTDVGDEQAYRRAVALRSGYDWTKTDEATYVLPDSMRVVKFWSDPKRATQRHLRAQALSNFNAVSRVEDVRGSFMALEYVVGRTGYEAAEFDGYWIMQRVLNWWSECFMGTTMATTPQHRQLMSDFYLGKTFERVRQMPKTMGDRVLDVTGRIDFEELAATSVMGFPHGDLNYGNLILRGDGSIVGIDWRESFGNGATFGDLRYDLAKLLAGCFVHWDNARRGDFRPWEDGHDHATIMRDWLESHRMFKHVEIIGALTLLHSAPLHAPPLDEILIARGCAWLEEVVDG